MTSPASWPTATYAVTPVDVAPTIEPKPPVTEAEFWQMVDHIADRLTENATTPEKVGIYQYLVVFPRAPKL